MKPRALEYLRCPDCRTPLHLEAQGLEQVERHAVEKLAPCSGLCPFPDLVSQERDCAACARLEVMTGDLTCPGCGRHYPISDGIPRFVASNSLSHDSPTTRTARSFGFLWDRSKPAGDLVSRPYHFEKMASALSLPALGGVVLDAGCGDGIDLTNQAADGQAEVVGVELSDGGCRTSFHRTVRLAGAHVVQADLCRLPFADLTFDAIYSYGVLHHVPTPERAAAEAARVGRGGARVAVYVYEDFSERSVGWRWLLRGATGVRGLTTKLPPRLLFVLCRMASPLVYVLFTIPFLVLRRIPALRALTGSLPFRHAQGPFRLAGDLYDRFSAPVEYRYSRAGAAELLQQAMLTVTHVAYERGWMVGAIKTEDAGRSNR